MDANSSEAQTVVSILSRLKKRTGFGPHHVLRYVEFPQDF